ncbi:general stress protein 26 [Isoptericola jiangsuensis]|uniref:General stress protein 26 n=1 Tax=Isoptericola jiangsuensis TaxID=548579 RepID=A0A2A9EYI1_9MICO|nr:pyridoxamine 5'-phosphate oxidase family protein [Isoptericola jiangsuensis]PFG43285.1 general stress protein 26 [Isoptericola jiangsuensis]
MSTDPPAPPGAPTGAGPLRLADVARFVRERADGVLTTLGPDGGPQAAYLSLTATERGELVLDARVTSRTVRNVRRDPRVAVVCGGADGVTLQAEGLAEEVHGEERRRCADVYRAAFPRFAGSLADPGIAVVRVSLTWARLGDYRGVAPVLRETTPDGTHDDVG